MAWTTPGTAVAGDVLTAAFWNLQVRDNLATLRALANVQSAFKEDVFTSSAPHISYQDVTGLSVTITPTSSTSKILIFVSANSSTSGTGSNHQLIQIMRGSTAIAIPTTSVGSFPSTMAFTQSAQADTSQIAYMYLDSPATTSATTYKIQARSSTNVAFYINQRGDGSTRQTSTLTAWEIPA